MALEGNVHDASRALELGIATGIGAIGPGIGVGFIFGKTIEAVGRQPEMRGQLQGLMWLGFALTEAIIFYALGMAFVALRHRVTLATAMVVYDSTLITPTTGLMIWTLVTFVVVLIVLKKYAFGPIQQMIDQRRVRDHRRPGLGREGPRGGADGARRVPPAARGGPQGGVPHRRGRPPGRRGAARGRCRVARGRDGSTKEQAKAEIAAETRQSLAELKQHVAELTMAGDREGRAGPSSMRASRSA